MRTNLERSDLARQSIGDMIKSYDVASQIAAREEELPYIAARQRADIGALNAVAGYNAERTRTERLDQQRVPMTLSDGRTFNVKPELAVLYQKSLDEAKADANKLVDVKLPDGRVVKAKSGEALRYYEKQIERDQMVTIPTPLGPTRMTQKEALEEINRQRDDARIAKQNEFNNKLQVAIQESLQQQRQESNTRADEQAKAQRRESARQNEGAVLSGVIPSGAYELPEGAAKRYIDGFNSNSEGPYVYALRQMSPSERTYAGRIFKPNAKRLTLKKILLPRGSNIRYLTAMEAYNTATAEGMELLPWLEREYQKLGLNIEDYMGDAK